MNTLSPIVSEFDTADDEAAYQLWFAGKVNASLVDSRPSAAHANVMANLKDVIDRAEKSTQAR